MHRLLTGLLILSVFCHQRTMAQLSVDFNTNKTGGCSPLVISFTPIVTGTNASLSYSWDLGNGNTAHIAAPEAVYNTIGTYTVVLTVSDGSETLTATHTIVVYAPPSVSFTASAASVCGTPVTFTGNTDGGQGRGITSWLWDFGDGTTLSQGPSASHQFATPSGGPAAPGIEESVALTVTDNFGCTANLTRPSIVKVFSALNTSFTVSQAVLCNVSDPVQFTNTSTGPGMLSYAWDFGDAASSPATSPAHTYAQKGDYTVKLTAVSSIGCTASFDQPEPLNVANYSTDFSYPATGVCQGNELEFLDQSSAGSSSMQWAVDGQAAGAGTSFYYTFPTAGAHTITLFNQFGTCPQSASKSVTVNPLPAATPFTVGIQQGCDNYTATFTDMSTGNAARSWDLNWSYGAPAYDFNNNLGATASYQYGYNYTNYVALLLTNAAGCTTLVTAPVYVARSYPDPFETDNNAAAACGQPVTKSFAYTYAGTLQSFHWDFGDGATSTSATPTHTWTQPGQYNIVFYYTDDNGCSGQASPATNVNIAQPFTVDFTVSDPIICAGTFAQFNMITDPASTDVYLWGWNYGDGTTDPDYQHQYTTPGVYTVTLTVLDFSNCEATKTKTSVITVLPAPAVYSGHTNTCDGDRDAVTFDFSTTAGTTLNWDFGDGIATAGSGSGTEMVHNYAQTGVYYTSFTATNGTCTVQKSDVVYVLTRQTPVLSAPATVCANGSLPVQLVIARDPRDVNNGDTYDYSPQFYYSDGTPFTGTVNFTNPSQPYNNGAFGWTLNNFQPGKSGLYVVTTSFGFNCTDISNKIPLTIIAGGASAAVTVISNDQCYTQPVVMKDASTAPAGNSISSGVWDFGDGQTQALVPGGQVSHVYSIPGSYTLQLTAHDALGCSVGGAFAVPVYANGPEAAFTSSGSPVLLGNTLYLYNGTNTYGVSGTVNYMWNFGDGGSSTDVSPTHLYAQPGTYTVTLTASAPGSCTSVAQATVVVQNFNSHFQISASYWTSGSCPPVLAQFTNTSSGYSSVSWDFGDGTTAGNTNYPSHVYQLPGDYTVTLSVFGVGGLIGRYTDIVSVRQPSATVSAAPAGVCIGQAVGLQAKGVGALGYLFDFGDGTVTSGAAAGVSHVYKQAGDYSAQLVVTDTVGCAAAAAAPVDLTVNPDPVVTVSPGAPVACLGSGVGLAAGGAVTYSWSPATGLDQVNVASPVASPAATTFYQVTGTDANGCVGVATANVKVVAPETLAVDPDSTAVCGGGVVGIKATGVDVYAWIGDTAGLSAVNVGNPTARPPASMHYAVVGSDSYGCFSDTVVVAVTVLQVPMVDAGPDVQVLQAQPVTLQGTASGDVVSWSWTPPDYLSCTDCAGPVCTPRKGETYIVTVTGADGCQASDTVVVALICEESRVRVPDAFTPNGDGRNDRFRILGIGEVDHLVIYDRWGVKVFERDHFFTADPGSGWDGTLGGQPAPAGVYAYFAQFTCPVGGAFARQGTVVLIR